MSEISGEVRQTSFLFQRRSVTLQRFKTVLLRSVSTTRVHGPSSRAELTGVKKCTRVLGPSTRPVKSGHELG